MIYVFSLFALCARAMDMVVIIGLHSCTLHIVLVGSYGCVHSMRGRRVGSWFSMQACFTARACHWPLSSSLAAFGRVREWNQ
jgi:hypothetical protein